MISKEKLKKLSFLIVICMVCTTLCACNISFKKSGDTNFSFASYKTAQPVDFKVYYDDSYFDVAACTYQPSLATASACLALAGFPNINLAFSQSDINTKEFFNTIGFTDYVANTDALTKPTTHSFGVYIAKRLVKDVTIIAVTVRGAFYFSEWASNFSIGETGLYATGFKEASDVYLNFLKEYILSKNITGKIKIWSSGFSRGGAVVNLSIGRLDKGLLGGEDVLPSTVTYSKDDLYAYCMEAPAGVLYTLNGDEIIEKGDEYNNIHNILNLNDPIPYVAPIEFGFVRYGIDYYLPDIVDNLNYEKHIAKVKDIMNKFSNTDVLGGYKIDTFEYKSNSFFSLGEEKVNWTSGLYLKTLIEQLSFAIGSREDYFNNYENAIVNIFGLLYRKNTFKDSFVELGLEVLKKIIIYDPDEVFLLSLFHNPRSFIADISPLLSLALQSSGIEDMDLETMIELLESVLNSVVVLASNPDGLACVPSIISPDNIQAISSGHYPELLLAHMVAMDTNYSTDVETPTTSYYKVVITGDTEHNITLNNKVIAKYSESEFTSSVVAEKSQSTFVYYLPSNANYKIEATEGELSIKLYEINSKYIGDYLKAEKTLDISAPSFVF